MKEHRGIQRFLKFKSCKKLFKVFSWAKEEAKVQIYLAIPIALTYFFLEIPFFVSVAFVGHLETNAVTVLAALQLGMGVINFIINSVSFGFLSGVDTLVSQAYGAGNLLRVGTILQRAILILCLVLLLQYSILSQTVSLLHLLHQPPCVIEEVGKFLEIFYAGIPAQIFQYLLTRYYQAQGIVIPFILTGIIGNVVNVVANYIFVIVLNLGIRGSALSISLCYYSQLIAILILGKVLKLNIKTWGGWSRDCLNGWKEFLSLAVPGVFMFCLDWWTVSIGYYIVGFMPDGAIQIGVFGIISAYSTILYQGPYSLGMVLCIRIGTKLGEGRPSEAKKSLFITFLLFGVWMSTVQVVSLTLKDYIPLILTSDECLLKSIALPLLMYLAMILLKYTQFVLGGVLRGTGLQVFGGILTAISFGIIGIPFGAALVIALKMGTFGYYAGIGVGSGVALLIYIVVILCINWEKRSKNAKMMATGTQNECHFLTKDTSINKNNKITRNGPSQTDSPDKMITKQTEQSDEESEKIMKNQVGPSQTVPTDMNIAEQKESLENESVDSVSISFKVLSVQVIVFCLIMMLLALSATMSKLFVYQRELCLFNGLENSSNETSNINETTASHFYC